jgi:hypothetical protein
MRIELNYYYYYHHHHHHHIAVKDVGQCWPVPASESICQFLHRSAPIYFLPFGIYCVISFGNLELDIWFT